MESSSVKWMSLVCLTEGFSGAGLGAAADQWLVSLPNQPQALQCQIRLHMPNVPARLGNDFGEPARRHHHRAWMFHQQPLQDPVHQAHIAIENARLHGLHGVAAHQTLRLRDLDARQARGPLKKGFRADLQARRDKPP